MMNHIDYVFSGWCYMGSCGCNKIPGISRAFCYRCKPLKGGLNSIDMQWHAKMASFDGKVKEDAINHPKHYTSHPSGVECITITRHHNFAIGNAIKYLFRAGLKHPSPVEDLKKAIWYIQDEIKRIEK